MAWLHNFRRIVTRYEYHVENYLGFVHLGCIRILLRQPLFMGWLLGEIAVDVPARQDSNEGYGIGFNA